jgi:hypothetical protein
MIGEKSPEALPREVPNYNEREAAHLRALAATATTTSIKTRLLKQARSTNSLLNPPRAILLNRLVDQ